MQTRSALAGITLALAVGTAPAASAQSFLFGGDFPAKPSATIRELFYESGMNCIRLTGGGYAWSVADHKALADDFQQRGLNVYLQLGSHYPTAEYFPLKEAWFVDHAGETGVEDRRAWAVSYSGKNWPQLSYAYVPFREKLEIDFANYLGNFATHTNISGVILHNEPGLFWISDRLFDYGGPALAYFHKYLQQQHGDVDTLNARWGTRYSSFQEIVPPGKPPVENVAAWMDFRRAQVDQIHDFLQWEAAFFKQQRPDIPRSTNLAGPLDHWYGYRAADNHLHSAPMDVVGIDIYPTEWSSRALVPYTMDLSHGVAQGRDVHVLECEVFSERNWTYSEDERADLLRGQLWTMIGHGAKGILMWGFSRNDNFSLTDGDRNARYVASRDIAHYAQVISLGRYQRPRPQVALCIDTDSYIYASAIEPRPHQLSPGEDREAHGLYSALADSAIPADVIITRQMHEGALNNYRAVILASARMMDEQTADALLRFTQSGGILIADTPLAIMDRWGKPLDPAPGYGLEQAFPLPNTLLLGDRVGVAYSNRADANLRTQLQAALKPLLPAQRLIAEPAGHAIDLSHMRDPAGNALIVLATLGERGKLPPVIDNVSLTMPADLATGRAAFLLAPTHKLDGRVISGPQAIQLTAREDGAFSAQLPALTAAHALLLATDAAPLIATSAPAAARANHPLDITITCYNPAPRPLNGTLHVRLGQAAVAPQAITLPAHGAHTLTLAITPGSGGSMAVLTTRLVTAGNHTAHGIPIDIVLGAAQSSDAQ